MKLLVPPPLVFLIFAGMMYVLATFLPAGNFDFFGRTMLIRFVITLAFLITVLALLQFRRKKTTTNPKKPETTKKLITSGIYNYTRNPMYLSLLLVLVAIGLYLQNAFNVLLAAGFVFYMNRFQIIPEEEALKAKFGQEYRWYLKLVRRWF